MLKQVGRAFAWTCLIEILARNIFQKSWTALPGVGYGKSTKRYARRAPRWSHTVQTTRSCKWLNVISSGRWLALRTGLWWQPWVRAVDENIAVSEGPLAGHRQRLIV